VASTGGGFLLGFGLCLLLISSALFLFLDQQYEEVMKCRSEVVYLYHLTHTQGYVSAMIALETLGHYTDIIADAIDGLGLGWLRDSLRQIRIAALYIRDVYYASEKAYYSMQPIKVAPHILTATILLATILIITGAALIIKARRKQRSPIATP